MSVAFESFFLRSLGVKYPGSVRYQHWLEVISELVPQGYSNDEIRRVLRVRRNTRPWRDLAVILEVCRWIKKIGDNAPDYRDKV